MPMPRPIGSPSVACQRCVERRQLLEHGQGRAAGQLGVVGLLVRGAPHRHQLVADVVDQHAVVLEHAVGQRVHHVADPLDGLGRPEPLADRG